jgi:ubiquinone/menaquinone biosynthesis C-methylase UbiE
MITFFMSLFKRYAWFKRLNAKITYGLLAKHIPAKDWHFMNYGYVPSSGEENTIEIPTTNQQYPLQMYHYLALKTEIAGKDVLEVGSGRGGGARHIASTFKPASYVGLDLAQSAVDLANEIHKVPNLKFIQGSAESIPLNDSSVDVVVNVESCHAYGSVEQFLKEVNRVLKPGGYFLMVDFRNNNNVETMTTLKQQVRAMGLELLEEEDITPNVIQSIEAEDPAKQARIAQLIPKRWQKLFAEFAGVVGSKFYNTLKDGSREYYRFVLRKAA